MKWIAFFAIKKSFHHQGDVRKSDPLVWSSERQITPPCDPCFLVQGEFLFTRKCWIASQHWALVAKVFLYWLHLLFPISPSFLTKFPNAWNSAPAFRTWSLGPPPYHSPGSPMRSSSAAWDSTMLSPYPLSWERKSTVPSSGILPPQALGIDFQRTIKNIARVFTEQHVFGLRVGVGYKGSLKGRQKRQRNRGVIKVQGITVCPCEENVDIDMFNVSWRTNTMKKGKLQMCFDYLKSDCCFHRWTVYPYFPRVHPAGWKMMSAIKFIRFIWF